MKNLYKDKPNLDHLRISLESETPGAKKIFVQMIKGATEIVGSEDGVVDLDFGFGCFEANLVKTKRGTKVIEPKILINRADFGRRGKDSVEPVIHHEAIELYEIARRKEFSADLMSEDDEPFESLECHQTALVEEFGFALERGTAEKHLNFMLSKANIHLDPKERAEFIRENRNAYNLAKKKFKKFG